MPPLSSAHLRDLHRALAIIRGAEQGEHAEQIYTRYVIDYATSRAFGTSHETAVALLSRHLQRRYPSAPRLVKDTETAA